MADTEQKALVETDPKALNYVQETVLKKRKNNEAWANNRRERREEQIIKKKANKQLIFKRPEQYIKDFRSKELDLVHMKQRKKMRKSSSISNSKLLFIVRIRSASAMHPKAKKILHLLRLPRIFDGVFVKANEKILDMLGRVEPYVTYGYPNLKSVKELVYKKGYARIDHQRAPLTDNNIVEQALGKHGIICLEDIVHEIATGGPHFKEVTSYLWPFKLNRPEGGLQGKKKPYKDGGDAGNREDHINELINLMN